MSRTIRVSAKGLVPIVAPPGFKGDGRFSDVEAFGVWLAEHLAQRKNSTPFARTGAVLRMSTNLVRQLEELGAPRKFIRRVSIRLGAIIDKTLTSHGSSRTVRSGKTRTGPSLPATNEPKRKAARKTRSSNDEQSSLF
jgi:hypothetical protein